MEKPTSPTDLANIAGISLPYASQILSGARDPAPPLAARIFRQTGWKHPKFAGLSDDQFATLELLGKSAA